MDPNEPASAVANVVALQARGCERAGSGLYARVLDAVSADLARGGPCHRILSEDPAEPLTSALALRFLGAVHRIVLEGREPELARHYPSVGGTPGLDVGEVFVDAVRRHRPEITRRLPEPVQTNEVGRSAVLAGGFAAAARRWDLPLRVLEIGASAGLNLRWDHYWYDTGASSFGDPDSPVRFTGAWEAEPPHLGGRVEVAARRGCDRNPIDPRSEDGRLTLLSYVWPDQLDRLRRLESALEVARRVEAEVDRADAPAWVARQLGSPAPRQASVVVHSIVLQYLSEEGRRRLHETIEDAGGTATSWAPLAWLRMEPAGERADLRVTWWPGAEEQLLATAGYHGQPIRWLARS